MKATAQLTFEKVAFDATTDAHLVVSLAAPHVDAGAPRAPVCVIPVLDVSGSMSGEKLDFAKRSILKLVDHLAPGDRCGVVAFSSEVETVAAPAAMTPDRKEALKAAVGRLGAHGNTNLAGGMLAGLDHARTARLPEGMRARMILFTDGLANAGPAKSAAELLALLDANLGDATLSAFGYGDDVDQDLLRRLSDLGKGNAAFVASPEDALTAFARELGGLLSTYAQAITVRVIPAEGAALTEVVSDVDARGEGGSALVRVPELLADEVRHLVLGIRLAPRPAALDAPAPVAEVEVAFERFEGGRVVKVRQACRGTVRFVATAEAQPRPTPGVDAIVAVAQLVRAQIAAEEAARVGHFQEAAELMAQFQTDAGDRGHDAIAAAAERLARGLGDEVSYDRTRAYRSSLRKGATRNASSRFDAAAEADLRAMGRAEGTVAQKRMETSFGAPTQPAPAARPLEKRRSRW